MMTAGDERVTTDEEGIGALASKVGEGRDDLVLALRTWICSPMARAASCTSRNMISQAAPVSRCRQARPPWRCCRRRAWDHRLRGAMGAGWAAAAAGSAAGGLAGAPVLRASRL